MNNTRRDVLKSLSLTGLLTSIGLPFSSFAKEKKSKELQLTTGADDRLFWANLLYKMAYPVVHNLAEGTLKKNMPLEVPPTYSLKVAKVTYMEAIGRTMSGIAPWLALPDDDTKEGTMRKQLYLLWSLMLSLLPLRILARIAMLNQRQRNAVPGCTFD